MLQMLQNKALTIKIDADVLENYPSFTADTNIDETDKNIKQEEVFSNNTIYIDHDKKITNLE